MGTGIKNTFIGTGAGGTTTDVDNSVIIGYDAGVADMTSAADGTVAIAYQAGYALTSGEKNIAIGSGALKAEDDGDNNNG